MTKFRIIEHGTKRLEPQWSIEKFGWTLFGKRWYLCSPYYESLESVHERFSYLLYKEKLLTYKKIIKEEEV